MLCYMAGNTRSAQASALGAALREVREKRGISQRQLALKLGFANATVSRWESGERPPTPAEVERIAETLELTEGENADLLGTAESAQQGGQWLAITLPERRQQLAALLQAERTATHVTDVAPLIIPGVLQTSDVIRSIMISADAPANEIDERVAVRIGRRELISRRNPAQLLVLLSELAIRQVIGGRQVWAAQLRYLLELSELPNIDIRVVPFDAGWTPALSGAFILIDSAEAPSIVNVENQRSGLIHHDPNDVDTHRRVVAKVQEKAMSPDLTRGLIATVLTELETQDDDTEHH
jgi:transcriptional regulator with XRE-family HTH domain